MDVHQFHIPVMGIGYTLDTPLKIAKYGVDSVVSLVQDDVIESARIHYAEKFGLPCTPISNKEHRSRSRRITAYLNMVNEIVQNEFEKIADSKEELQKLVRLLPEKNVLVDNYDELSFLELQAIHTQMTPGKIDVNIMSKLDRQNDDDDSDAIAALRGFAESNLSSSLVISAGVNPGLVTHIAEFKDFLAGTHEGAKKKVVVKVSDYRSAVIQGKMLAKKGVWPSEFRIESGLNCGGHTFATQGLLLGPILEEFKQNRKTLQEDIMDVYQRGLTEAGIVSDYQPQIRISAQGGIGNHNEQDFLMEHYELNHTGWGSPFLLVPEATTLDDITLMQLTAATEKDIYSSNSSPLGVKYSNLRNTTADILRKERIEKGKPGSPCFKKHLALNTEFGKPLCTASREYQKKKLAQIEAKDLPSKEREKEKNIVLESECICDGLATSFLKRTDRMEKGNNPVVSVCPGPNLAYFSRTYTFKEMVDHIYGRMNIVSMKRPNLFMKEINLYFNHLKDEILPQFESEKLKKRNVLGYIKNMQSGIEYYQSLFKGKISNWEDALNAIVELTELNQALNKIQNELEPA